MKIALVGYGKMGKTIEQIARNRGHEIVSIIDVNNPGDFESEAFKQAVEAGRTAYEAKLARQHQHAQASSPLTSFLD